MDKRRFFRGRGYYRFRGRGRGCKRGGNSSHDVSHFKHNKPTEVTQTKITAFAISSSPYPGWKLYFPEEVYSETSSLTSNIKAFEKFIGTNGQQFSTTAIENSRMFNVDLKQLLSNEQFLEEWRDDFLADLKNYPEKTISSLGLSMHQTILLHLKEEMEDDLGDGDGGIDQIDLPILRARVINFEPIIQLKQLKSNYYGKLVSIRGTIIRVGSPKLLCTWMAFECNVCQSLICVRQPEGVHTLPDKCTSDNCRSRSFNALLSSPFTLTINWQSVRLQENTADEQREGGRVPRTIDCELTSDLVDTCSPGDLVTITGIVKVRNEDESRKKCGNVFLLYMDVISVMNTKSQTGCGRTPVEFNMKDYYAIKEIHSEPQLFRLLIHSLCPSIFGHELVKAGLMLCLLGGCQRTYDSRADPHILIVGDPGLGKSKMLQACANVTPRGVYVCGNTSTSSGLTVTLKREGGGDYALEAGALVLSDQGCCCIDEFDKMGNQHQALLEAMEQQTVSIAKAGVVCSLPARTSILAAANPVGGHYNKAKTVSENLRLGPALLSRFDLVFILLDLPNEYLDCLLSEHVMALHSDVKSSEASTIFPPQSSDPSQLGQTLRQRLKLLPGEELDVIPHQLLRKYIAYARKYVKPRLQAEAAEKLQQFYLELRRHHHSTDCTPVTTRQLESMIRLTEARAKMELRDEATGQDAEDIIEIMKASMVDTWSDDLGALDLSRSLNGSGTSSKNQVKKFIAVMQRRSEQLNRSTYSLQELKDMAKSVSITVSNFSNFVETLNIQGFLLKKGSDIYQLLTA